MNKLTLNEPAISLGEIELFANFVIETTAFHFQPMIQQYILLLFSIQIQFSFWKLCFIDQIPSFQTGHNGQTGLFGYFYRFLV